MSITAAIVDAVTAYVESHDGTFPARAYVSKASSEALSGQRVDVAHLETLLHVGHEVLGVTDWYIDEAVPDGDVRLEP